MICKAMPAEERSIRLPPGSDDEAFFRRLMPEFAERSATRLAVEADGQ